MKNNFLKNYKTTIIGLCGAILIAIEPIQMAVVTHGNAINYKQLAFAIAVAFLGYFAKDGDKTGITK